MTDKPYKVDLARERVGNTGIYVRAQSPDGGYVSADIVELERESLARWLRSHGGANLWAENTVLQLLGHQPMYTDEMPPPRDEHAALRAELASAECVVRQVARDTYGKDMTVKEFADAAGYDS